MAGGFSYLTMEESKAKELQGKNIDRILADIITGARHMFIVDGQTFHFYPVTLAKSFKTTELMKGLSVNHIVLKANPYIEALRLVETRRDVCCRLLALHAAPNTQHDFFDRESILNRASLFEQKLSLEALAMLLVYVLTADKSESIVKFYEMDKEHEKVRVIMEIKARSKSTSITYGGKSIFGTRLCPMKGLGYSDNEILYERPYAFLQLMLADKADSIYLSEEEYESVPIKYGGSLIMADDPDNIGEFEKMAMESGINIT